MVEKILVIEDEESIREIIVEILEEEGFKTLAAEDGEYGINLAIEEVPDLILCDVVMPELNGYDVLRLAQQNSNTAVVPFIFLTSKAAKADLRQGMELGADDYLTKPCSREELLAAVRSQLKKNLARKESYRKRLQQAQQHLKYMLEYDNLTGLPSRMSLREQFDRVLKLHSTNEQQDKSMPIFCLCLDRLTKINETFGYRAGNLLLKTTAARLTELLDDEDEIAYLNDNKFIIILSKTNSKTDAIERADCLLDRLRQFISIDDREVFVSTSLGIAFYPDNAVELEDLLEQARISMDYAKKHGGDRYQLYQTNFQQEASEHITLETSLRQALEREELQIYYQPKVSLLTGKIVGAEALVRWNHPNRGRISPSKFIAIAEETSLIVSLGEWVLEKACRQVKTWNSQLLEPISIAVNLSSLQFMQSNLCQNIDAILKKTNLDSKYLELELTESILVQNPLEAVQKLQALKKQGIKIALDDFGTGYSSLSYLRQFAFDTLKIDRSFVCNLNRDPTNKAIVTAIIQMAHTLQLKVVAEGVETEAELAFLSQHLCDEIQGYLFSSALKTLDFEQILFSRKRLLK